MVTYFACPNCGCDDAFVEENRSINDSALEYIDADTGEVHYTGYTEYGECEEVLGYRCTECDHEFAASAFSPEERTAKMLDDLKAVLSDIEELTADTD